MPAHVERMIAVMLATGDGTISPEALSLLVSGRITSIQNVDMLIGRANTRLQSQGYQIVRRKRFHYDENMGYSLEQVLKTDEQ